MCRKQLKDYFNTTVLHETVMQILDMFMSTGNPHHWIDYLMPEDTRLHKQVTVSDNNSAVSSPVTKFDQLMAETREVLSRYVRATGQKKRYISYLDM